MQRFGNLWGLSLVKMAESDTGGSTYNPQTEDGLSLSGIATRGANAGAGLGVGFGVNNLWNRAVDSPDYTRNLRNAKDDYKRIKYYNKLIKSDPDSNWELAKKISTRKPPIRFNEQIRRSEYPLGSLLIHRREKVQNLIDATWRKVHELQKRRELEYKNNPLYDWKKFDKIDRRYMDRIKLLERQAAKFDRLWRPARGPYMNILRNRFNRRGGILAGALAGLGVAKTLNNSNQQKPVMKATPPESSR